MKNKKIKITENINSITYLHEDLHDFLRMYQQIYEENKDKYETITIELSKGYVYSYDDTEYAILEVKGCRLETDEEYDQRKQKDLEKDLLTQERELKTLNDLLRKYGNRKE